MDTFRGAGQEGPVSFIHRRRRILHPTDVLPPEPGDTHNSSMDEE
jgi:hypothetical protein